MPSFDFVLAGRYRLLGPLGEGGMATVYRARDLRLNREVAVKLLREELTRDATFLQRFEREAQTVAGLTHPNIVPVYDVGEEGGSHFIVMEYVRGRTLKDAIESGGALPQSRAIQILVQILDALEHAHARGLIHRDVKPHNILLAADGTARLADFGIAHLADGSTTRTAAILGSAHYLSPEQSRGEEATVRSDLYACGIILFEMLAGYPPFDGPNALAIAHEHLHDAPPHLNVGPDLQRTVSRALEKDPEARFPDAAAFANALRSMGAGGEETVTQPLVARSHEVEAPLVSARPVEPPDDRLVFRRSARKWYIVAAILVGFLCAAAYVASHSVWGQQLPSYPSAPYALVPGCLAVVVLLAWFNARSWIYTLDTDAAIVQWGLLSHHRFGVPLRSVASLELKQSPLDRILRLGTIEIRARDLLGKERTVVLEDVTDPRRTYDDLVRMVGRSLRSPGAQPEALEG